MERQLRLAALRQMHFLPVQESTCQQVQQCMQAGASALLQKLFKDYLLMRLDTRQRARGKARKRPCHWLHYRATSEISTLPEPA